MSKILEKQSKAKRIKILLKNYKKMWGSHQELANFKEPVVMLMRHTRKVEWYDNATSGWFVFEHSDGSKRRVKLSSEFIHTFDYGRNTFKGYLIHENYPTPLPEDPIVTAEQIEWVIDKTQKDIANHKAKILTARGNMIKQIAIGLGILVVAYYGIKIVAGIFGVDLFAPDPAPIVQVFNASNIV